MMTMGMLRITAVAISCIDIRKSPSPTMQATCWSGQASLAPSAAGSAQPIGEKLPEVMWVRGAYTGKVCLTAPCVLPEPTTTMPSRAITVRSAPSGRCEVNGAERLSRRVASCRSHSCFRRCTSLRYDSRRPSARRDCSSEIASSRSPSALRASATTPTAVG